MQLLEVRHPDKPPRFFIDRFITAQEVKTGKVICELPIGEGAIKSEYKGRLIAAAPELLEAIKKAKGEA